MALLFALAASGFTETPAPTAPPAPDFALKSLNGENLRLSEFQGQVVLLNFWATWAGASRQQMPALQKLHTTYSSAGLVLLGINVDENRARAAEFAATLGISYPVLFDPPKTVAPAYGLRTLPTTVLIDRAGRVRHVFAGYPPGSDRLYVAELRALLDE